MMNNEPSVPSPRSNMDINVHVNVNSQINKKQKQMHQHTQKHPPKITTNRMRH
jgi:hypothetical protein